MLNSLTFAVATILIAGVNLFAMVASAATKAKAAGININLWAGLAMAACGALFLAWVALGPLRAEELRDDDAGR
jgi:hypothetical protein